MSKLPARPSKKMVDKILAKDAFKSGVEYPCWRDYLNLCAEVLHLRRDLEFLFKSQDVVTKELVARARRDEREACAKIAEEASDRVSVDDDGWPMAANIIDLIRTRGVGEP